MKRKVIAVLFLFASVFLFAQGHPNGYPNVLNDADSINRKTAQRCMQLAEKKLLSKEWKSAHDYAIMGLSYDNTVSDLVYIKAAAEYNLDYTKRDVLNLLDEAFEINEWIGYNLTGARILYADMLSEIGEYEKSNSIIDADPYVYSADAEFIRVKNGYRIGTVEAVDKARDRVFSARRIYPTDFRFINIFFIFEGTFKNLSEANHTEYEIPAVVQTIADAYIKRMPYDENPVDGIDILATMFTDPENQLRLLKSIRVRDDENPLFAIVALKAGLLTEQEAFDLFFAVADHEINYEFLDIFIPMLTDEIVVEQLKDHLVAFNGILSVDTNLDFISELNIKYERGRAAEIHYDKECDGVEDIYAECDFGAPVSIQFPVNGKQLDYAIYPSVSSVVIGDESDFGFIPGTRFSFVNDDLQYSPFEMVLTSIFTDKEIEFYVPFINEEIDVPTDNLMFEKSSCVGFSIGEREDAYIEYSFPESGVVSANFYCNEAKYASCKIEQNKPFIRYVDYNNDGFFEASELFNVISETNPFVPDENENEYIEKVFGKLALNYGIYLEQIQIDSNGDTVINYTEKYLTDGGKIVSWDFDSDGLFDIRYSKYKKDSSLIEESEFRDFETGKLITVVSIDGIPVKMNNKGTEWNISAGFTPHIYWVGDDINSEEEAVLIEKIDENMIQGVVDIIKTDKNAYCIIKIGDNYFFWR